MTTGTGVEDLLRELAPQVLGVVIRRFGDFDSAEDAVQEALIAAARHWPADGRPANPRGWLIQAAVRRMTDQLRSERARRRREDAAAMAEPPPADVTGRDDTLILLFMCCHPALTPASAIALTLRAVGGLTTAEIANAFLVPESTMAQRISRAKQRIKASGVPFLMPEGEEWAQRLRSVMHVLYLIFSEGYASSVGADLHRTELSGEAIRLARMLHAMLPGDGEVTGLLALMLLTDARRLARTGAAGELIPLAEQDRTLWDRGLIAEGVALITESTGHHVALCRNNDELYDRKDIDAVIIATADFQHAQHGIEAVHNNLDAYVEKPMAHTMEDAREFRKAVRQTGRKVQIGTQRRSAREPMSPRRCSAPPAMRWSPPSAARACTRPHGRSDPAFRARPRTGPRDRRSPGARDSLAPRASRR